MNLEEMMEKLTHTQLNKQHKEAIEKLIDQFLSDENQVSKPVDVCPKCGKIHPKLIKAGKTRNGKQMLRCGDCNKRFVEDREQLTFYSHEDLSQWKILLEDTFNKIGVRQTAAKIDVHYVTAFRMRHKFFQYLVEMIEKDAVTL
jgi:transposase-like protein